MPATADQLREYAKLLVAERDAAQLALAAALAENETLRAGVSAAELRCQELNNRLR